MCLAILTLEPNRLFLAANRDEERARPSAPPRTWACDGVTVTAPIDERAGGTWLGCNDRGLFAVITNRSDLDSPAPGSVRSRGHLVREVLEAGGVDEARARVEADRTTPSAPFNLLFGEVGEVWIAARREQGETELRPVMSSLFVVSNHGDPDDDSVGEIEHAREAWAATTASNPLARGHEVLTRRANPDGLPPLLKTGAEYGTVSASVLELVAGRETRFWFADGPPHVAAFEEVERPSTRANPPTGARR